MTTKPTIEQILEPKPEVRPRIYAYASQLVCLANLENFNPLFINEGMTQSDRLKKLNRIAIEQMEILTSDRSRNLLGGGDAK